MPANAIELWQQAVTFKELRDLTAKYVTGEIDFCPGNSGEIDGESSPIAAKLAQINQNGLMTVTSQPGEIVDNWKQRAYVNGFALEKDALKLAALTLDSNLHIAVYPPEVEAGISIPITVRDYQPHGWGGIPNFESIVFYEEVCPAEAIEELREAWFVSVIDLEWGREMYLSDEVTKWLTTSTHYSIKPHPDLNPDGDDIFI